MHVYNQTVDFVEKTCPNYGHLINSAGEIMDYDRFTKKFDISPNSSFFIEFTKLCAALPSCWEDNKKYQLPDNQDHLSAFR